MKTPKRQKNTKRPAWPWNVSTILQRLVLQEKRRYVDLHVQGKCVDPRVIAAIKLLARREGITYSRFVYDRLKEGFYAWLEKRGYKLDELPGESS